MKRILLTLLFTVITLVPLASCGSGKGVPTVDQAKYVVISEQAPGRMTVYTSSYRIENSILLLEDGYYAYSSGWVFNPTYTHYRGEIAFTDFAVRERHESERQ